MTACVKTIIDHGPTRESANAVLRIIARLAPPGSVHCTTDADMLARNAGVPIKTARSEVRWLIEKGYVTNAAKARAKKYVFEIQPVDSWPADCSRAPQPDESEEAPDYGRIAFQMYANTRNREAFDGSPLPDWADVAPGIKAAWRDAAAAVIEAFTDVYHFGSTDL